MSLALVTKSYSVLSLQQEIDLSRSAAMKGTNKGKAFFTGGKAAAGLQLEIFFFSLKVIYWV